MSFIDCGFGGLKNVERTCRDRSAPSGLMRIKDAIAASLALMVVLKIGFSAEKLIPLELGS